MWCETWAGLSSAAIGRVSQPPNTDDALHDGDDGYGGDGDGDDGNGDDF